MSFHMSKKKFMEAVAGGNGYRVQKSLRFRSGVTAYMSRTPTSNGSSTTFTLSVWVKTGITGGTLTIMSSGETDGSPRMPIRIASGGTIVIGFVGTGGAIEVNLGTTAVLRDPSAWYHIVVAFDTTQATAANRRKVYVNNVLQAITVVTEIPQNYTTSYNSSAYNNYIGVNYISSVASELFDGLMADYNFIDGQQLDPSSFGVVDPATGIWGPKKYTGSYGTNGFHLDFADTSAIGKDTSGNGNTFSPTNMSVTPGIFNDSLVDVPTNYGGDTGAGGEVRGNYATLNPLKSPGATLSNGNLNVSMVGNSGGTIRGTMLISSGKWYWECTWLSSSAAGSPSFGIAKDNLSTFGGLDAYWFYPYNGNKASSAGAASYASAGAVNDIYGVAYDADNGTLTFYKNGTSLGVAFTGLSGEFGFAATGDGATSTQTFAVNFGQRQFAYAAPSGYKALCTQNLPDPAIKNPAQYFDINLRTGTGAAFSVTGKAFQPDLAWIKSRSATTQHALFDSVRGAQRDLDINPAGPVEVLDTQGLSSFNSDGFSGGTLAKINTSAASYVDWLFKKGALSGVDIVTYTGNLTARTIAHSLGAKPSLIFIKNRDDSSSWFVWANAFGAASDSDYLVFQSGGAKALFGARTGLWNSTPPTASVFSVGANTDVNNNTSNLVAFLFADAPGFSKHGGFTGNGSADGPFVYCGFRPRFLMVKRTDTTGNWNIIDGVRDTVNAVGSYMPANGAVVEGGNGAFADFLSNGFKIRSTNVDFNASGGSYIFMCFAEAPFKYARAR